MTMHAEFFKENEGIVHNSVGQMPSDSVPWWSGLGSQLGYGESVGLFKSSSLEHSANGSQLTATKQAEHGTERGLEKGNTIQFSIFPDHCKKASANGKKTSGLQEAISAHSAPSQYQGCYELGFGQPVICMKYPYADQCYGVLSTYGHQIAGRIMLPLNLTTDDGPIYVNAKQYHGIIRRRLARAKAGAENKVLRARKPYLHLSRHLHAMRRPRGCGGRFLNSKPPNSGKNRTDTDKTGNCQTFQPAESQNSEVLQSESVNLNSPSGSTANLLGSEVTSSIFSTGNFNQHAINHLRPSANSVSNMLKWVAADPGHSNLKTCRQGKGGIGVELLAPPRS